MERLHPGARLLLFEVNGVFVNRICAAFDDPRHDSAENMGKYLEEIGIKKVDYMVSAIPFTTLPESLTKRIVRECRHWLRTDGEFIQFHYSPLLLSFYRDVFGNAASEWVTLNLTPAMVISCKKTAI